MVHIEKLENGLTVIVEEMAHVESVAYELMIPGGILSDEFSHVGCSLVLGELTSRGAGDFDSKQLSDAFEDAGIRHGEGAGYDRYSYRGALLADKLPLALSLVSKMAQQPQLPEDELESIQSLFLQDIASLDDHPSRKAMIELSARYYSEPYNRPGIGTEQGIKSLTIPQLRQAWQQAYAPGNAILSIAGNVKAADAVNLAKEYFAGWRGAGLTKPKFEKIQPYSTHHIHSESAQVQIALAFPSVKFGEDLYYAAKVMNGVLSGGMFGRLFIEVREKRGLCYSVFCRHSATKEYGTVIAYAGTTPERAHQTLEVMVKELRSLKGTISNEELSRSKANLKSSLIISEESAGSRASSNASDYWLDGRVRSLEEIGAEIDKVTKTQLDQCSEKYPAESFTLVTLGNKEISLA